MNKWLLLRLCEHGMRRHHPRITPRRDEEDLGTGHARLRQYSRNKASGDSVLLKGGT